MQQTNYEVRVGLFSLFALILLVWGWTWLKSFSLFHQPQRFVARFDDVAGLSNNATVNVQGVRVGTVEYLSFTPKRKIDVHLKITDPQLTIPRGADISIQTIGLVGAKYLEITLPRDKNGNILDGEPLLATDVVAPPGEGDAKMGVVHNPVRVELIVNHVASRVDEIVENIDTEAASHALNNLSAASAKLNTNMDKLKEAAASVQAASNNIAATSSRFGKTADNASAASERASVFFKDGDVAVNSIKQLAGEFRGTDARVNKLLDNPNFSSDLKETVAQARQTADSVRAAMSDLGTTLKDKSLREDVLTTLSRLQKSTDNIKASMDIVNKISGDQGLRNDIKDAVKNAKEALTKANTVLNDPAFRADLSQTVARAKSAATNVDIASKQIQQILDKRSPLLQMLFGRPGKITPKTCAPNQPPPAACPPPPVAPVPGVSGLR